MPANYQSISKTAWQIRRDLIEMIYQAQSGHPAGSLGMADIFTALFIGKILRHDSKRPEWNKRDYFFLSNGHISPVFYATLSKDGYFPEEELKTFRHINSRLQGHPHFTFDQKKKLPGIENTSGPLGQGLSQAAGMAIALEMDGKKNKVFCMMSDGEQQEGQIWEAYQFIIHHHLNNLIGIIDFNNIQISGSIKETLSLGNLKLKLMSFGFKVLEMDAHDFADIFAKFELAKKENKQPVIIIAKSIPGKGVSFMEKDYKWHGKAPSESEYQQAIKELAIKEKYCG
ncbi:MAG: Transketolase domain protein [Candidatus Pacebacteria bacterium GW2011_GWF2_38_9]|nr:MAG: transketolase domain-containing protein, transketolase [candidate division TM6 bacterium GW2011_GWF2_28_16]KKQ08308.1 MAG: Transketolase domain protein [Candidatus Pacebacteria bacterium GW2011_GWF1_36_5]KKQ88923.1 MAG: Transketolase domain protein [Candidatus Pacebacteria bacterium GW2011_GWF2_38_9]HAZ73099.1 transketolase [Candidatus Paceibacterota bacterium]